MTLDHLWAGWRREYIVEATERERAGGISHDEADCVFCGTRYSYDVDELDR